MRIYARYLTVVISFLWTYGCSGLDQPISYVDEYHWDWTSLNTNDMTFSPDFLVGVATSSYQIEGGNNNVWDRWAAEGNVACSAGAACDGWHRYKEDVQLIKNVHANAYRFSVEWSRVELEEGIFDEAALDHYAALCAELCAQGIAPVITLHHYNDPIWFADKGGFENDENIELYVRFAKKVIDRLHDNVHLWLTFNSPTSYAAKGYQAGRMPPGKKSMQLMAQVLKNLLCAHVRLYHAVKADPVCAHAQVGTLHNICQIEALRVWNKPFAWLADYITHQCLYTFFTTGVFRCYIPGLAYVHHEEPLALQSLDFIGLNYYTHMAMNLTLSGPKAEPFPGEAPTMSADKTMYPEGFYKAIKEIFEQIAEPLSIPIYVTENGIAPCAEEDRELFLRRYWYAMHRAMQDGCDVRGYFYWSLMDNYEWGTFGEKRYGLYAVDFATFERTLRPNAAYFIELTKRFARPWMGDEQS